MMTVKTPAELRELRERLDRADTRESVPLELLDDIAESSRLLGMLASIFGHLDGEEWNSDTTAAIGETFTGNGWTIHEPGYYEEEDED